MNYEKIVTTVMRFYRNRTNTPMPSIVLLGPPGIGKTSLPRTVGDLIRDELRNSFGEEAPAFHYEEMDQTTKEPIDMGGVPTVIDSRTDYAGQRWIERFCVPGAYGIIVLDDVTAADPRMQVASRQLVLERRINNDRLSDNVLIFVTGNRRIDKAAATTLPSHFINACVVYEQTPNQDQWVKWYREQKNLSPAILGFLDFRSSHFSRLPSEADALGRFPTPRSWTKLGAQIDHIPVDDISFVAEGFVGQGIAIEFASYMALRGTLPSAELVLANPQQAIPDPKALLDTPDKTVAMMSNIAEIVAKKSKVQGTDRGKLWVSALNALGWVTAGRSEYSIMSLNAIANYMTERQYQAFLAAMTNIRRPGSDRNAAARGHEVDVYGDKVYKSIMSISAATETK